jgi:NAD-dependent SIR2 family protein deacetylase
MTSPDPTLLTEAAEHAAELIGDADALLITAGAGMGVDSGLPDFRGRAGFWRAYPALADAGLDFAQIASPRTFEQRPRLAWGFYGHRLALYRRTVPHAGFAMLLRWAAQMPRGAWVFTSNVDGQFQRAGFPPGRVHECHGSIHRLQCTHCDAEPWSAESVDPQIDETRCEWMGALPSCPACGALARPNILMFNDDRWHGQYADEKSESLDLWLNNAERPLVVEIGAGSAVATVRNFGQWALHAQGARMVRINPREHRPPTALDVGIAAGAMQGLEAVDRAMGGQLPHTHVDRYSTR